MRLLLRILCAVALGLTLIPACLRFTGSISDELLRLLMLAGALLWFASAIPASRPR